MIKIEAERLAKIQKLIHKYDTGFPMEVYKKEVKVPLKFIVTSQFYNNRTKFQSQGLNGRSLFMYVSNILENEEIKFDEKPEPNEGEENEALRYFMDPQSIQPTES